MNWPRIKLFDQSELITDGNWIESKDQSPTGVRLIQTGNIGEGIFKGRNDKARYISEETFAQLKCTEIYEGDCLVSRLPDPVGRACILPNTGERMITAVDCSIIRLNRQKILPEFFIYYSQSATYLHDIEALTSGATRKRISRKNLSIIKIPTPPLPEQQRIVALLDSAFADIDKARANAEQNLKNARELFESYLQQVFCHLGDECNNKSMSDTSMLSMIDGDRGKNYPSKSEFSPSGHCLFLSTKNVRPNGFRFEEIMFIDKQCDDLLRNGKLDRNDVVLTTRGTIGNLALYDESVEYDDIRINSGMLILRPNTQVILPAYLFEIMRSGIVKRQIEEKISGAAQPQLPVKTLNSFTFPVPTSIESQAKVVDKIRLIEAKIQVLTEIYLNKLAALDELKISLLHKAFTGQLNASAAKTATDGQAA